jgi:hypothetical protein
MRLTSAVGRASASAMRGGIAIDVGSTRTSTCLKRSPMVFLAIAIRRRASMTAVAGIDAPPRIRSSVIG